MITFMAGKKDIQVLIDEFGDAIIDSSVERILRGRKKTTLAHAACFASLKDIYWRRFPNTIHLVTPLATDGVIGELATLFPSFTWWRTTWEGITFTSVSFRDDTPFDLAYNALCLVRLYSEEGVDTITLDFEVASTSKGYRVTGVAEHNIPPGLPVRRMLVNAAGSWFSRLHLPMHVDDTVFNVWTMRALYRGIVHPDTLESDDTEIKAAVASAIVNPWIERITTSRYPNDPWKTTRRLASGLRSGELAEMLKGGKQ